MDLKWLANRKKLSIVYPMQIVDYLVNMWALASEGDTQGVFFWVAFYAFLTMSYSLIFQIRVTSWPSTTGELLERDVRERGYAYAPSDKEYILHLSYKYSVNGSECIGNRLSPWLFITNYNATFILKNQLKSIFSHKDGSIDVFYNPAKPHKSFLIKPGLIGKLVTGFFAIAPFILYWVKYYS